VNIKSCNHEKISVFSTLYLLLVFIAVSGFAGSVNWPKQISTEKSKIIIYNHSLTRLLGIIIFTGGSFHNPDRERTNIRCYLDDAKIDMTGKTERIP